MFECLYVQDQGAQLRFVERRRFTMHKSSRSRRKSKSSREKSAHRHYHFEENEAYFSENQNSIFDIKNSEIMGRYMVATKDIEAGELILKENPLVVGPCTGCKIQCISCYKELEFEPKIPKCPYCNWPLCSEKCQNLDSPFGHTKIECSILKECNSKQFLDYDDVTNIRYNLHAIVPLRCLILKVEDPSAYEILMNMESHDEIRKNISEVWSVNQNIVDKILKEWKLTEHTEKEIHKICGILEVNAFEIGQQGVNIRGIYPKAFLMSHDCVPNTNHTDEDPNYTLTVRASVDIKKHHPITLSYAYTLQNTFKRREHLLENKFFECFCKRCSDPTELGTYCSALICPKCRIGFVLPDKPLDNNSTWSCTSKLTNNENKCPGYTIQAKSYQMLIQRISQEYESLNTNDIPQLEAFLQKYRNVLHSTHYICLGIKLSLSQLYGKIEGYLIQELNNETLKRKIGICKEILKIFDVIEPGLTKLRGVTLYELHAPLMILLIREYQSKTLNKLQVKDRLEEVSDCLTKSYQILKFESKSSAEGLMAEATRTALIKVRDWNKILKTMSKQNDVP